MKNKGITLIALVITIIVLIILAGISISMLAGDNSILSRAGEASDKTEYENLKEEAEIVLLGRKTNKMTAENNKTLKEDLEAGISGNKTVEEVDGVTDVCYVKRGKAEITVYDEGDIYNGEVSVWKGNTDTESPEFKKENNIWYWYIYTPAQLKFLADFVNNGNQLTDDQRTDVTEAGYTPEDIAMTEDTVVYLMNNLDLGARKSSGTTEEQKWETEANEAKNWTPIGITGELKLIGTFEGNNNTIKGVYVNSTKSDFGHGLFGNSNTIQNLTIKDSYIKGGTATGGIVGKLKSGKLENCHNENTTVILIEGIYYSVGGVVGQAVGGGGIIGCSNSGIIIGNGKYTGGQTGARRNCRGDTYEDKQLQQCWISLRSWGTHCTESWDN